MHKTKCYLIFFQLTVIENIYENAAIDPKYDFKSARGFILLTF